MKSRKLKRVVLKEEYVDLTGCPVQALILNQMIYWTERVKDFDKFIQEEKGRNPEVNMPLTHGWVYKKSSELAEELMLGKSETTIRRAMLELVNSGMIRERSNADNKWDKTKQYRVDLALVAQKLSDIGHQLQGYLFENLNNEDTRTQYEDTGLQYVPSSQHLEGTYIRNTEITTEITNIDPPYVPPKNEFNRVLDFESRFAEGNRQPWRTGAGVNDFDDGFVDYLTNQWKQETHSMAKAFLRTAPFKDDKYTNCLGYWEEYNANSKALPPNLEQYIFEKFKIISEVPQEYFDVTGKRYMSQYSREQLVEMIHWLEENKYAA